MRVITCNVNGIRSATAKGLWSWLASQNADVICLQEVRAKLEHLPAGTGSLGDCHGYFNLAARPGYSGVAIYSRQKPLHVSRTLDWPDLEDEGRFIQLDFAKLSIISLYLPSGSSSRSRQQMKYEFLDHLALKLEAIRRSRREVIICGDINIAHKEIDLKNWRGNKKNSGFLPLERAWMDWVTGVLGFVDAFRAVNQEADQYTWWSNRGAAYAKNVGWRIDYQLTTPGLKTAIKAAEIYKSQRFSDHAPLILDYDLQI